MKEVFIILESIPYEGYEIVNNIAYVNKDEVKSETKQLQRNNKYSSYDIHTFLIKE